MKIKLLLCCCIVINTTVNPDDKPDLRQPVSCFCFSFFLPIFYLRPSFSLSLLVVTQIRGHRASSSPLLPTTVRAFHFHRDKISTLSSLFDSRWIVLTHARRSQQLILFVFANNFKTRNFNWPLHPTGRSAIFWISQFVRKNYKTYEVQVPFFFFSSHLLSLPFFFLSLLVVTQIRGHIAGYSPSWWGAVFKKYTYYVLKERLRLCKRIGNWVWETHLKMGNMKNESRPPWRLAYTSKYVTL